MFNMLWEIVKFVFWLVLFVAVVHTLTTHFILWFELRLSELIKKTKEALPLANLFKSFCTEAACTIGTIVLIPFGIQKQKPETYSHELHFKKTPILLIHGYLHNQAAWLWFKRTLKLDPEVGPIFTLNLCPPFASLTVYAELLQNRIAEILKETGQSQIILIGHSMGGLVASFYNEFIANPNEVLKVITLGAPFQGTKLVALGMGENVMEMSPQSLFLNQLNEKMQNSKTPYYYVASKIDNIVVPWQSALPFHLAEEWQPNLSANNVLVLEDHGHLRLLISQQVLNQVKDWVTASR